MKSRNVIVSLFLVLFLIAAGGAWWLFMSVDGLVKHAIERWGTEIAGVAVRVDSVRIQVTEGHGTIRGLHIGNPKGFEGKRALELGEIRLTIDPASVTKDVVVIRELLLVAPEVAYERGQGGDNLLFIQKNMDAWAAQNAGANSREKGPGRKFVIESVVIRNGKAQFGSALSSPIPDLQLRDVGRKSNGATAGDVARQLWRAVLGSVTNIASRVGPEIGNGIRKPSR